MSEEQEVEEKKVPLAVYDDLACNCSNSEKCPKCRARVAQLMHNVRYVSLQRKIKPCVALSGDRRAIGVQSGRDFTTFVENIETPAEFCMAVVVQTDIEPNSAPSWLGYKIGNLQCTQVIFVDTRKPIARMLDAVVGALVHSHTLLETKHPRLVTNVHSRASLKNCQCGNMRCAGNATRLLAYQQSHQAFKPFTALGHAKAAVNKLASQSIFGEHLFTPIGCCPLASIEYDQYELAFINAQIGGEEDKSGAASHHTPLFDTIGSWQVYDDKSGLPMLRCEADAEGEGGISFQTTAVNSGATVNGLRYLSVEPLNVDYVQRVRNSSLHKTTVCALHIQQQMEANARGECVTCQGGAGCGSTKSCSPQMREMIDEALKLHGQEPRRHPDDCACLINTFISRRCTKQLVLRLTPSPHNALFEEVGGNDTIYDIRSEVAREHIAKQYATRLIAERRIPAESFSWSAETRTDADGIDVAIMRQPVLHNAMARRFGEFRAQLCTRDKVFKFTPVAKPTSASGGSFQEYCEQTRRSNVKALATKRAELARLHNDITGTVLGNMSLQQVLDESRRVFGKQSAELANAPDLCTIVFHRGLLGDTALWAQLDHWCVPAVKRAVAHATSGWVDVEGSAAVMTEAYQAGSDAYMMNLDCQRSMVHEACTFSNRRMIMARIAAASLCANQSMGSYREKVVFCILALMVLYHIDQLAAELLEEKKRPPKPVVVAVAAPEVPKMVKAVPKETKKRRTTTPPKKKTQAEPVTLEPLEFEGWVPEPPAPVVKKPKRNNNKAAMSTRLEKVAPTPPPPSPPIEEGERLDKSICRAVGFDFFDFLSDQFWLGKPVPAYQLATV